MFQASDCATALRGAHTCALPAGGARAEVKDQNAASPSAVFHRTTLWATTNTQCLCSASSFAEYFHPSSLLGPSAVAQERGAVLGGQLRCPDTHDSTGLTQTVTAGLGCGLSPAAPGPTGALACLRHTAALGAPRPQRLYPGSHMWSFLKSNFRSIFHLLYEYVQQKKNCGI